MGNAAGLGLFWGGRGQSIRMKRTTLCEPNRIDEVSLPLLSLYTTRLGRWLAGIIPPYGGPSREGRRQGKGKGEPGQGQGGFIQTFIACTTGKGEGGRDLQGKGGGGRGPVYIVPTIVPGQRGQQFCGTPFLSFFSCLDGSRVVFSRRSSVPLPKSGPHGFVGGKWVCVCRTYR